MRQDLYELFRYALYSLSENCSRRRNDILHRAVYLTTFYCFNLPPAIQTHVLLKLPPIHRKRRHALHQASFEHDNVTMSPSLIVTYSACTGQIASLVLVLYCSLFVYVHIADRLRWNEGAE